MVIKLALGLVVFLLQKNKKMKIIISYDLGYKNWYVSEFYQYFHRRIIENYPEIKFEYIPLRELASKFGFDFDGFGSLFANWYNLILYNEISEKFFIHSWYDYATAIPKFCLDHNIHLTTFSCASNLTQDVIEECSLKEIDVKPSPYYLESWSDYDAISKLDPNKPKKRECYFAGANHGIRQNILRKLSKNNFFKINIKSNPRQFKQKDEYFEELSSHAFGLSLNGAATICYRDLELFGTGVLNLRAPLNCLTHNPILKDVHFIEFIDDKLLNMILNDEKTDFEIENRIQKIEHFIQTEDYNDMINESKKWFNDNCSPESQFNIISSFLKDFSVFE
jgi:hypothetical protein